MNQGGTLGPEWIRLVAVVEEVKFGEITVKIRNGKPVLVEKGVQTIKLEE